MKHILLLTDFSENSLNAIDYSMHLFKGDSCDFFVLHVKSSDSYTTDDLMAIGNESIYNTIVKDGKEELDRMVLDLKTRLNSENFTFNTIVDFDNLTDAINQVIKTKSIDLIVMGTNGVTGAKEVVFGSNTINVIRTIDCPTLVVPKGFDFRKANEILLPLDVEDTLSGNAFNKASKFTDRFSKKVHLLRIIPNSDNLLEDQKDKKDLGNFLKNTDSEYHIVNDIPMNYVVDCYIQTHQIDLMILLVQPESLLERFFMGSATTKISNSIRVPLLVFHT
ncbi:universal stress protein [Winogradskyella schleiferi]|uniref:universal stress protein n=1 Tax=Winogradskyella schleiferi TaxID=2686078 RepID=UPI0015BE35B5|nr:universal stress protein [Winogradskyella schleiferi]